MGLGTQCPGMDMSTDDTYFLCSISKKCSWIAEALLMPISENQVTFLSPEGFLNTSCGLLKRFALGHNWSFPRAISCKRSNWESGVCLVCPCRIHSQELCIVVHCSIFPDWIYFLIVLTCICRYKTEELGYTSKKSEGRQKDAVGGWSKDHGIHYNKFHFLFVHLPWSNSVLSLLSGCGRPVWEQNLICSAAWNHRSSLVFSAASWVGTSNASSLKFARSSSAMQSWMLDGEQNLPFTADLHTFFRV